MKVKSDDDAMSDDAICDEKLKPKTEKWKTKTHHDDRNCLWLTRLLRLHAIDCRVGSHWLPMLLSYRVRSSQIALWWASDLPSRVRTWEWDLLICVCAIFFLWRYPDLPVANQRRIQNKHFSDQLRFFIAVKFFYFYQVLGSQSNVSSPTSCPANACRHSIRTALWGGSLASSL